MGLQCSYDRSHSGTWLSEVILSSFIAELPCDLTTLQSFIYVLRVRGREVIETLIKYYDMPTIYCSHLLMWRLPYGQPVQCLQDGQVEGSKWVSLLALSLFCTEHGLTFCQLAKYIYWFSVVKLRFKYGFSDYPSYLTTNCRLVFTCNLLSI